MTSVLVINDDVRARAAAITKFAVRKENVYRPGPTAKIPGDNPQYVLATGSYRAVFSVTEHPQEKILYKHLSISVLGKGRLPSTEAVSDILPLFGFTGTLSDCMINFKPEENCVVVIQAHQPVLS